MLSFAPPHVGRFELRCWWCWCPFPPSAWPNGQINCALFAEATFPQFPSKWQPPRGKVLPGKCQMNEWNEMTGCRLGAFPGWSLSRDNLSIFPMMAPGINRRPARTRPEGEACHYIFVYTLPGIKLGFGRLFTGPHWMPPVILACMRTVDGIWSFLGMLGKEGIPNSHRACLSFYLSKCCALPNE